MAIEYIHQDSQEGSSDNLPLLRNWCKQEVRAGRQPYEEPIQVRCVKVSKSGEWVIVETDVCVALVNTGSSLGTQLELLITLLKGEGYALVLVPHKKGKLGFSVGLDKEITVYYKYDAEEEYLWITNKHAKPTKTVKGLDVADILKASPPTYPSMQAHEESLVASVNDDIASARKKAPKAS